MDREQFPQWLCENENQVEFIFHPGARTDTTEFDREIFDKLNVNYTKEIWNLCIEFGLPLAELSAATYGLGEHGYVDSHDIVDQLTPLNLTAIPRTISTNGHSRKSVSPTSGQV